MNIKIAGEWIGRFWCALVAVLVAMPVPAAAGSILTSQDGYAGSYYVGAGNWSAFTARLDAASGGNVSFTSNFENLSEMLGYDALLVSARDPAESLSAAERLAIEAFMSTGRRVLLFGENDNWNNWNQQIIEMAGGSYIAEPYDSYFAESSSLLDNDITVGAGSILGFWVGVAEGGTQLYSGKNFVSLWGTSQNVLTILDENVVEDGYQSYYGDAQFTTNVANWLAGGASSIPAPPTLGLLGLGLALLGLLRRPA
jgi:hypothetical protein